MVREHQGCAQQQGNYKQSTSGLFCRFFPGPGPAQTANAAPIMIRRINHNVFPVAIQFLRPHRQPSGLSGTYYLKIGYRFLKKIQHRIEITGRAAAVLFCEIICALPVRLFRRFHQTANSLQVYIKLLYNATFENCLKTEALCSALQGTARAVLINGKEFLYGKKNCVGL